MPSQPQAVYYVGEAASDIDYLGDEDALYWRIVDGARHQRGQGLGSSRSSGSPVGGGEGRGGDVPTR
jgi:hypothetical protein